VGKASEENLAEFTLRLAVKNLQSPRTRDRSDRAAELGKSPLPLSLVEDAVPLMGFKRVLPERTGRRAETHLLQECTSLAGCGGVRWISPKPEELFPREGANRLKPQLIEKKLLLSHIHDSDAARSACEEREDATAAPCH
jgi:hypothetical protein